MSADPIDGELDLFGSAERKEPTDMAKKTDPAAGGSPPKRRKPEPQGGNGGGGNGPGDHDTNLHEEARRRYLNYALSVITSRALPDVRDGLKPVQRRILYTMFQDHRLTHEAKYQKCA